MPKKTEKISEHVTTKNLMRHKLSQYEKKQDKNATR